MSEERLQKILARAGIAARRKAEELIRDGRVTINGQIAKIGDKADPDLVSIKVDDKRVHLPKTHRYLVLNKPKGYLTTVDDPGGRPTVLDLVPPQLRRALVPVGRLDFMTEGLLLLTDDGDFAQRIAHPSHGCHKVYEVKVKGYPPQEQIERLRHGVLIDGERTAPCRIEPLRITARRPEEGNSWWEVELGQGRSRQIREMFFRIEHPVQKLRRVAIGPFADPKLLLGTWRELTDEEVEALRRGGTYRVLKRGRPLPGPSRPRGTRRGATARPQVGRRGGDTSRSPADRPTAHRPGARSDRRGAGAPIHSRENRDTTRAKRPRSNRRDEGPSHRFGEEREAKRTARPRTDRRGPASPRPRERSEGAPPATKRGRAWRPGQESGGPRGGHRPAGAVRSGRGRAPRRPPGKRR